jgi:PhnB protein
MFEGRCEEAAKFYEQALGAKIEKLVRFKDTPAPSSDGNKVMHMSMLIGDQTVLASDGQCGGKPNFQGFSLSLHAANEAEAQRLFASLSDGGQVQMPLTKTFWSPAFGMVADRFGVSWMINVAP